MADTGAREPQPKPLWTLAALVDAGWGTLTRAERWTILRDLEAALAAGVGVPPDAETERALDTARKALVALSDYNEGEPCWCPDEWWNRRDESGVHMKSCDLARAALDLCVTALAGVGEARPDKPSGLNVGIREGEAKDELGGAPTRERPDAQEVARLQHIIDCANTPLMRDVMRDRDKALAEVGRLREQLDAARKGLERYGSHDDNCVRYRHDYKVRFRNSEPTCLCGYEVTLRDARAALGVVGETKLPSVDDHPGYDGDK